HEEGAVGIAVTQGEREAVVAVDACDREIGVPVAESVADAEAELIGIGNLEIVVQRVDLLARVAGADERLQVRKAVEVFRIPGYAGRGGRARMVVAVKENRGFGQRRFGLLELQIVEQVAVVGAPDTTE